MKKILFSCIMALCLSASAQVKKIGEYTMSIYHESFKIEVSDISKSNCKYYIQLYSDDCREFDIRMSKSDVTKFIKNLEEMRAKFVEWSKTAKDNNVEDYSKKVPVKFSSVVSSFYKGNEWFLSYHTPVKFEFAVIKGIPTLIYYTGRRDASDNRFINASGTMAFKSVDEINKLIDQLNTERLNYISNDTKSKDDLFK